MATSFSHPSSYDLDGHPRPGRAGRARTGAIRCESCHIAAASLDYSPIDCTTCHSQPATATLHIAVADLNFTTATETSGLCLKCHASRRYNRRGDHTADHAS